MTRTARYHIDHQTTYRYESAVSLSRQQLHLTPRDGAWQNCLEHRIEIDPEPTHLHSRVDAFGNPLTQFDIESPHGRLVVRALSTVDVRSRLTSQGAEVVTMTPAETDKFFNSERARWRSVVQAAKLQLD